MIRTLWEMRERVRASRPLVYNITNHVVTNFTANVLLAAGAAPIMSEGAAEAADLAQAADVLVLNIGTLHTAQISYCLKAGEKANQFGKPIVFDPVGVGATAYRNMTSMQILQDLKISLIRGNASEISFLNGMESHIRGVDGADNVALDRISLQKLTEQTGAIIAATGPMDLVADANDLFYNDTGHSLLTVVTGTGCALSSLAGAFLAVAGEERSLGVLAALTYYGAAAEKAAKNSKGPGSFAVKFLDTLFTMTYKDFKKYADGRCGVFAEASVVAEQESAAGLEKLPEESSEEVQEEALEHEPDTDAARQG